MGHKRKAPTKYFDADEQYTNFYTPLHWFCKVDLTVKYTIWTLLDFILLDFVIYWQICICVFLYRRKRRHQRAIGALPSNSKNRKDYNLCISVAKWRCRPWRAQMLYPEYCPTCISACLCLYNICCKPILFVPYVCSCWPHFNFEFSKFWFVFCVPHKIANFVCNSLLAFCCVSYLRLFFFFAV